jgi:peptide/nickel transport system substrate-binding protein
MKKLLIMLAIVSLIGGQLFAGGGSQAQTEGRPAEDKVFNIIMSANWAGFDPLRTNDSASTYVNAQVYETLYRLPPGATEFTCVLAERLPEFSADGRTVTIRLRQGVKFHDGTPFNAAAVKHSFDLIRDPSFPSGRRSIVAAIERVDIVDDYTIRMPLSYADGVLTAKLAHTNAAIVSPTAQRSLDLNVHPVGTGAYKFVSSISGAEVVLERFDDYWGGKPAIKNVKYTVIADESTALARMETGEADFFIALPVPFVNRARSIRNITVKSSEASNMYFLAPRPNSWKNPKMADRNFRIAIAKAIDIQGFVDHVVTGFGVAAHSVMGQPIFGYDPNAKAGYPYDPAGARKLIADNGWGNELINFLVPSTPTYIPMGEYIQANLKAVGFNNVQLEMIDWAAWLVETGAQNRFDLTLNGWSNITRDGSELFEPNWHSTLAATQRFFINSKEVDDFILASKTTAVPAERIRALRALDELMMREVYTIPLYYATNLFCYSNMYDNVNRETSGSFYIKDFTIK